MHALVAPLSLHHTLLSFAISRFQEAVRYITIGIVIYTIADALGFGITWSSISTFIASFGIAIGPRHPHPHAWRTPFPQDKTR
jgi:hypothetical protein